LTHIRVGPVMERLNKFTAKHNAAIQDVLE
jgi:hypothetical protein